MYKLVSIKSLILPLLLVEKDQTLLDSHTSGTEVKNAYLNAEALE